MGEEGKTKYPIIIVPCVVPHRRCVVSYPIIVSSLLVVAYPVIVVACHTPVIVVSSHRGCIHRRRRIIVVVIPCYPFIVVPLLSLHVVVVVVPFVVVLAHPSHIIGPTSLARGEGLQTLSTCVGWGQIEVERWKRKAKGTKTRRGRHTCYIC